MRIQIGLMVCLVMGLMGCQDHNKKTGLQVGVIAGPESALAEVAVQVANTRFHRSFKLVRFSDYNTPNMALADGSIGVNIYQHLPFLNAQKKARGYAFTPIGRTFIFPMGLYSRHIKSLSALTAGNMIAIPNDPTNLARALFLLQKAGLIGLRKGAELTATPLDIISNPKQLKIVPLAAPQLPRALADVTLAAINTSYALPAGLSPTQDALFHEGSGSLYANLIVVRTGDKDKPAYRDLVAAMHSPEVIAKAKALFGDSAIPAWPLTHG